MRYLILGASLLVSMNLVAQLELTLNLQQGYTRNIFRNPATFEPADGEPVDNEQLLQSGTFTAVGLAADWQQKWEKSSLRLSSDFDSEIFPSLENANLLRANLSGTFEQKLSKKFRFYQKVGWRLKQRQGDDGGENIFTLPNAYRQLEFLTGVRWKPNKDNLFRLEGGWLQKAYQPTETSVLTYQGTQYRIYHRLRLEKGKTLRYVTTSLRFQNRNYLRERFSFDEEEEFEEEENFTENTMRYFILDAELDFELNDNWTLSPSLELTGRTSDEERLAYWQVEPTVSSVFEKGKWKIYNRVSFAHRQYPNLMPEADDYSLRYFYATLAGRANYQWKDNWSWIGSWAFTQRLSNFDDPERRAFRPYQYWRVVVGLEYRF